MTGGSTRGGLIVADSTIIVIRWPCPRLLSEWAQTRSAAFRPAPGSWIFPCSTDFRHGVFLASGFGLRTAGSHSPVLIITDGFPVVAFPESSWLFRRLQAVRSASPAARFMAAGQGRLGFFRSRPTRNAPGGKSSPCWRVRRSISRHHLHRRPMTLSTHATASAEYVTSADGRGSLGRRRDRRDGRKEISTDRHLLSSRGVPERPPRANSPGVPSRPGYSRHLLSRSGGLRCSQCVRSD